MDYQKYGLPDVDQAAKIQAERRAIDAEVRAVKLELHATAEPDPDNAAILSERAVEARAAADELRKAAKLTTTEMRLHAAGALQDDLRGFAEAHLQHELEKRTKAAQGIDTSEHDEVQQALEESIAIIENATLNGPPPAGRAKKRAAG